MCELCAVWIQCDVYCVCCGYVLGCCLSGVYMFGVYVLCVMCKRCMCCMCMCMCCMYMCMCLCVYVCVCVHVCVVCACIIHMFFTWCPCHLNMVLGEFSKSCD